MDKLSIFQCGVCGNIVEVLHVGGGTLVCCNQNMNLLEQKNKDEGNEKHVPLVEESEDGVKVKVGSVQHPMEDDHFIQWIELITDKEAYRKFLIPGNSPEAEFCIKKGDIKVVRELCNKHGLWKT